MANEPTLSWGAYQILDELRGRQGLRERLTRARAVLLERAGKRKASATTAEYRRAFSPIARDACAAVHAAYPHVRCTAADLREVVAALTAETRNDVRDGLWDSVRFTRKIPAKLSAQQTERRRKKLDALRVAEELFAERLLQFMKAEPKARDQRRPVSLMRILLRRMNAEARDAWVKINPEANYSYESARALLERAERIEREAKAGRALHELAQKKKPRGNPGNPNGAKRCARSGPLTSAERKKLPAYAFGLPNSRDYPLYKMVAGKPAPSASHAKNAKARASQQFAKRNITRAQFDRIYAKADRVIVRCKKGTR